ncbi:hypothetical protein V22_33640 [Calycomorphotria hydatis]|uniref:Uncharacterized protein n=1 Tax=Calycomorphotria hydatis TaxID=2528027 RepID=A0A517TCK4_9PLAN|nr:hypothetical protein V22_33640 [Calycomorphotria hydatis]
MLALRALAVSAYASGLCECALHAVQFAAAIPVGIYESKQ